MVVWWMMESARAGALLNTVRVKPVLPSKPMMMMESTMERHISQVIHRWRPLFRWFKLLVSFESMPVRQRGRAVGAQGLSIRVDVGRGGRF